jgi:hypothetical protein
MFTHFTVEKLFCVTYQFFMHYLSWILLCCNKTTKECANIFDPSLGTCLSREMTARRMVCEVNQIYQTLNPLSWLLNAN